MGKDAARDDAARGDALGANKGEHDDASELAKAKARAAAGDHERGLAPEVPPAEQADGSSAGSGETPRGVKGDPPK